VACANHEYKILIARLKQILKQRGLTYRNLAKDLGVSEAGVKRIFSKADGKISTLSIICGILGIAFSDLVASSDLGSLEIRYFTEEQDDYFVKHFDAYVFFNELVIRKKPFPVVQKELNLNTQTARKYLHQLDRLGLIELGPRDKIKIKVKEPIGFFKGGRLLELVRSHFIRFMTDQFLRAKNDSGAIVLHTREWAFSRESFASFKSDMAKLIEHYDRFCARDHALLDASDLVLVNLIAGLTTGKSPYLMR
jgi:transcriptional regulator with XRE-family HTH domain